MASKLAAIYASGSKIMRRIVVPDHDWQLPLIHVAAGESLLLVATADAPDVAAVIDHVYRTLGIPAEARPHARCAVIHPETQLVTHVITADPALDTHPAGRLIPIDHPGVAVGWKHDGTRFLVPLS